MASAVDAVLVAVLLLNFFLLGVSRLRAVIQGVAVQGGALGSLVLLGHGSVSARLVVLAAGTVLIKGLLIPRLLTRAMREASIRREVEPIVGYVPSLLLGGLATGAALVFARSLPLAEEHQGSLLVPASLATVLVGFILITTRRKAISLVVGYLVLENGIFILGMGLLEAMPFLVEIGVLLDLFVCVFAMGIMIHHISREFSTLDSLSHLKE